MGIGQVLFRPFVLSVFLPNFNKLVEIQVELIREAVFAIGQVLIRNDVLADNVMALPRQQQLILIRLQPSSQLNKLRPVPLMQYRLR